MPLAVVDRFDDRIACGALAELESVEVVLGVSDGVVGAHSFAEGYLKQTIARCLIGFFG